MESKLQSIRKSRGLSQSQLAKLAGVTPRVIQCYEIGARQISQGQAHIVIKLADALGVHPRELMED